ncbi:26S proteasome non-ATPase regulatory subunit 6-like protein, partial [Cucurbita argyrosperma subsp. argyrosperma]
MEGQEGTQQPHLVLSHKLFLLTHPDVQDIEKVNLREEVLASVKADDMAPLYEALTGNSLLDLDRSVLDSMRAKNEEELKKLDEKIADAEENLGESEVREAHLAKSLFFIRIGDKDRALEQLKVTESKTVAVGLKMDLVFHTLALQFLESYKSVTIKAMANAFGVSVEFIDLELSRFIAAGKLHCKIDKVAGVLETNRPDSKNALYQATIKQGDFLLNRIQKLSRVIDL